MRPPVAPNTSCAPAAGSDLLAFVHSWAMADDAMARLAATPSTTDANLLTLVPLLRFCLERDDPPGPGRFVARMDGSERHAPYCHGSRRQCKSGHGAGHEEIFC